MPEYHPDDSLSIQELAELVALEEQFDEGGEDRHLEAAYEDRFGFPDDDGYNDYL